MDTATNIECNFDVSEDGSYSFNWVWTYAGNDLRSNVYEEIVISRPDGWILGGQKEAPHLIEPGGTYIGANNGGGRMNPGDNIWRLKVLTDTGEMLGLGGGRIFAAIPQRDV